ncbi:hypothetical protein C0J52_18169 [Blattella germanica]|nr:hypothetical protein C0J52_18169 [Blattella germanica]
MVFSILFFSEEAVFPYRLLSSVSCVIRGCYIVYSSEALHGSLRIWFIQVDRMSQMSSYFQEPRVPNILKNTRENIMIVEKYGLTSDARPTNCDTSNSVNTPNSVVVMN